MVKHGSSILKFHSLRDITSTGLQLPQLSCIILLLPNAAVWCCGHRDVAGVAEVGLGHLRSLSWVVVAELEVAHLSEKSSRRQYKIFSVVM